MPKESRQEKLPSRFPGLEIFRRSPKGGEGGESSTSTWYTYVAFRNWNLNGNYWFLPAPHGNFCWPSPAREWEGEGRTIEWEHAYIHHTKYHLGYVRLEIPNSLGILRAQISTFLQIRATFALKSSSYTSHWISPNQPVMCKPQSSSSSYK